MPDDKAIAGATSLPDPVPPVPHGNAQTDAHTGAQALKAVRQAAFLAALTEYPVITRAAKQVGIARETHYDWLREDPTYRARYAEAIVQAGLALEEKALELAMNGWEEPVWHEGKQCGVIIRRDNRLHMELLKGAMPTKYRERASIEHSGPDGKPIQHRLTLADIDRIVAEGEDSIVEP